MERSELKSLLEALLFTSTEPLAPQHFRSVVPDQSVETLVEILAEIRSELESKESGIVLREVAGGFQFFSHPRWHNEIQKLFSKPLVIRLSRSALETLAIVAYKQPITLPEISEIRSCNAAGAIKTLLECNFIKVLGRKRVVGRPFLYGTNREFLIHFGLKDLSELPQLSEFEELVGEKLSREMFETSAPAELITEAEEDNAGADTLQEPEKMTEEEAPEIYDAPFEE